MVCIVSTTLLLSQKKRAEDGERVEGGCNVLQSTDGAAFLMVTIGKRERRQTDAVDLWSH